jgi:hypothetical protein
MVMGKCWVNVAVCGILEDPRIFKKECLLITIETDRWDIALWIYYDVLMVYIC